MAHEIARLLLEQTDTFLERTEAVKTALSLGMPLREIEEYLDWLDMAKSQRVKESAQSRPASDDRRHPRAG